jgi:hypothetical protein
VVVLSMSVASCALGPLTKDDQLHVLRPRSLSDTTLPVQITWSWSGPRRPSAFALFLDRTPIRPGQTLRAVVPSGDPCRVTPGCPDVTWLRQHGVILVSEMKASIPAVAVPGGTAGRDDPPVHQVTIVLLDGRGRRIGEAAYPVLFRVAVQ